MSIEELVDDFNNGEFDENIKPYFNDALSFLKYAYKYEFVTQLDFNQIPHSDFKDCLPFIDEIGLIDELDYEEVEEEFKNTILLYQLEKNSEKTLKYVSDQLVTDVYQRNDGYYLYVKDREELANLFDSRGRDYTSGDVAKNMLGEDYWEPFFDTTHDVYGDVIDELNEKNINILAQYIIKNIGNQELSLDDYDDELFHLFSEEQETEELFKITSENVMRLIKDKSAMNEMLKKDLDDLKSDLYSIHNNAYNTAYTDEIYGDLWSEISTYFDVNKWETETKQTSNGKQVNYEYLKIKDFGQIIYDFLVTNENETYSESFLDYWGTLIGTITSLMDDDEYSWLSLSVSDYADWTLTKKYINELFPDYI
jgi:hypothetical protein